METYPLRHAFGGPQLEGWQGIAPGNSAGILAAPGTASFRLPEGPRGWYKHGLRPEHDGSLDLRAFYGLRLDVCLEHAPEAELRISIASAQPEQVQATLAIAAGGWRTLTLPWSAFGFEQARTGFLKFITSIELGISAGRLLVRNVAATRGAVLALECPVRGKAAPGGGSVAYPVVVGNCTSEPQRVTLQIERHGWEAITATVEPARLLLGPGKQQTVMLHAQIGPRVPPGGHERQVLQAIPNGDASRAARLHCITAAEVAPPYLLHTPARWQEVRDKVQRYAWAAQAQHEIVALARAWQVPAIAAPPENDPNDTYGPFLFKTAVENDLMRCGSAWQLTGERVFAEKIALFLERLCDPRSGYPAVLRGCSQHLVQEGHFFQHIAMAYDMVRDAGVFSAEATARIETTFRAFIETIEQASRTGAINNWNISEIVGAFYCALALQDLVVAERFFSGPAGITDQLAKGTMDDGWWYECSISYNMWCAAEFCQVALAYEPWGINFRDMRVPAAYSPDVSLSAPDGRVELSGGRTEVVDVNSMRRPFGMSKEIWGPNTRPYREIRDLWNGLLPFIDYRGVLFGINDSTERQVSGHRTELNAQPFEIAYYVYRDPAYAAMIRHSQQRDLLYGVPELPAETPEQFRDSAYADNVGVVMLRSQAERPMREQIQAVLHYGTHGWAHGHFDRTGLISLMRYGRSFYNPEAVWYSYEPFMYKFYVQASVSQNMVVVDQKMQEAVESQRLLFHSGALFQAAAVETTARWSHPPYGGMVYDYVPVNTFAEKCWREGRHVPMPNDPPAYGSLSGYTEPIRQRRTMLVTDAYVLLIDDLAGEETHMYENLLQIKGFGGLEAAQQHWLRHDAQWNPDPLSSAQFVTNCQWYAVEAPARAHFTTRWGEGADNEGTLVPFSEDGVLHLDVHSLWPPQQEIMIGSAPEYFDVQKRLFFAVHGDGATLAEGAFGAWILGQETLDLPLDGINELTLQTCIEITKSEKVRPSDQRFATEPTVFWADARIVTEDGRELALAEFAPRFENVRQPPGPGLDYAGGPITVVGTPYQQATPGEPEDATQPALVHIDLRGHHALRFRAVIGGDYPLGDERQRRKTYAVRTQGRQARFLTLIEPFEDERMVRHAYASSAGEIHVELADGRVHEIRLGDADAPPSASIRESRGDQPLREESTG